jgi:hypothetical protein
MESSSCGGRYTYEHEGYTACAIRGPVLAESMSMRLWWYWVDKNGILYRSAGVFATLDEVKSAISGAAMMM